jgi:hypothetical protein
MCQKSIENLVDRCHYVLAWLWIGLTFILGYFHSEDLIRVKEKQLLGWLFNVIDLVHRFLCVIWKLSHHVVLVKLVLNNLIEVEILINLLTLAEVLYKSALNDERVGLDDMKRSHLLVAVLVFNGVLIDWVTELLLVFEKEGYVFDIQKRQILQFFWIKISDFINSTNFKFKINTVVNHISSWWNILGLIELMLISFGKRFCVFSGIELTWDFGCVWSRLIYFLLSVIFLSREH